MAFKLLHFKCISKNRSYSLRRWPGACKDLIAGWEAVLNACRVVSITTPLGSRFHVLKVVGKNRAIGVNVRREPVIFADTVCLVLLAIGVRRESHFNYYDGLYRRDQLGGIATVF